MFVPSLANEHDTTDLSAWLPRRLIHAYCVLLPELRHSGSRSIRGWPAERGRCKKCGQVDDDPRARGDRVDVGDARAGHGGRRGRRRRGPGRMTSRPAAGSSSLFLAQGGAQPERAWHRSRSTGCRPGYRTADEAVGSRRCRGLQALRPGPKRSARCRGRSNAAGQRGP